MSEEIPQVLREIPPEKFRELIETLLGAPLQHQSSGSRREVVENPTEEQLRLPHDNLMGGKIMLRHRRELLFETDWLPLGSEFALSVARVTYLGAMSGSRFKMGDGTEVECSDRWAEIVGRPGQTTPESPWPEKSRAVRDVMAQSIVVQSVRSGVVERVEREASEAGS